MLPPLRHGPATRVLHATHSAAATQDLLGHASPAMTRIYTKLTDEDTKSAHRKDRQVGL